MNVDAYFTIGKTHEVCEDYALCSCAGDNNFAVLSDGCSGSPRTDFGARFLVLATERWLKLKNKTAGEIRDLPNNALRIAHSMVKVASLPSECLDATLAYIFTDELYANVLLAGDGVVAARRRSGGVEVYCVDYISGAPAYLNYQSDSGRRALYLNQDEGFETLAYLPGKDVKVSHGKGLKPHYFIFDLERYDLVAVMSDGAMSFQRVVMNSLGTSKHFENIPTIEVVEELMAVKSSAGKFVARRCKRFLKQCAKKGWHHNDDLSMAALYIE
ncbi:hypothetical protein LCGC14_0469580 [marine sediment metagenome]|uniref:PPM-type phosphatase domain-containing protein n=1 Tax=marine sediment metagenome TaxID=412755 RepID=A0A0F9VLE7_9ZZZZ